MRQRLTLAVVGVVGIGIGFVLSGGVGGSEAEGGAPGADFPMAIQQAWFPPVGDYDTGGEPLDDERFDGLLAALDEALTARETLADFERQADIHLWSFTRRLVVPEVTGAQMERIGSYLDDLAEQHPDHVDVIDYRRDFLPSYARSRPTAPPLTLDLQLFGDTDRYPNNGEPFSDAQVDELLGTLDAIVNLPEIAADIAGEGAGEIGRFAGRLQRGQVSEDQAARIDAFFDELEAEHPDAAESLARHRFRIENLTPGRVAPNIRGTDTEGVEFALEDYRGKVVALIFSGQWCGPCRGEYPYQRAMLDIFGEDDVALLGVNSDAMLETIVQAKEDEGLDYRTWWDGHSQPDAETVAAEGPIATEWGVRGWPTIYVLDDEGVIRFVNKRGGALIDAVDQLLRDQRMREYQERTGTTSSPTRAVRALIVPASAAKEDPPEPEDPPEL
ncbi:MAG: redoxin domain-containing protein [Gemmatimonadetes bacterium]|nr:redoxin domain-containing protein [Gemmatimonadota bacterium]